MKCNYKKQEKRMNRKWINKSKKSRSINSNYNKKNKKGNNKEN